MPTLTSTILHRLIGTLSKVLGFCVYADSVEAHDRCDGAEDAEAEYAYEAGFLTAGALDFEECGDREDEDVDVYDDVD
jgi:hypothetical protein